MKNIEITLANGEIKTIPHVEFIKFSRNENLFVSFQPEEIQSIRIIAPKAQSIKDFNSQYQVVCKTYWDKADFFNVLYGSLQKLGVKEPRLSETINRIAFDMARSADGALRCWELLDDIYLCITWHQMRDYTYEFVVYVS